MSYPIISADSHVTETPDTYRKYIDAAYRDDAPYLVEGSDGVEFHIRDIGGIRIGGAAAAGIPPAERKKAMSRYADLHRGGWDSSARLADQDRDGIAAEVIYPTIGMLLCNHPDMDYKRACLQAYNRWIAEYCSFDTTRLLGVGQTAVRTPEEGIADIAEIKALGLRGIMLPGTPGVGDYDGPEYHDFWEAVAESGLPAGFHIIAAGGAAHEAKTRGPQLNGFLGIIRGVQDIIGMLIYNGVFERHPTLRVVCVEGDAGWVPHYAARLDRAYREHRHHLEGGDLLCKPSDYLFDRVYFTFQDDHVAFQTLDLMNFRRLMWANDFPHSDATWPHSQSLLAEHTSKVPSDQKEAILSGNAAELYGIDLSALERRMAA